MDKYVLDTNLFFNMEPGLGLGRKTEEVITKATAGMKRLKEGGKAEFYMPPRVVDELLSFFEDKGQEFLKEFLAHVSVKSPVVSDISFPAQVFYELVSDIRLRSYRGLAIAEDELMQGFEIAATLDPTNTKDFQMKTGKFTKSLRDRYRQATRAGFLDSVADLDLIVLAKELDAYLVSTDEGVMKWGRMFGAREMEPTVFGKKLVGE